MAYNSLRQQDSSRLILGVRKDVNTLIGSMNTAESDIDTAESDIDTAESDIDTIQAQLDDCTQSIVTGSRVLGTVYQNTSGKTMFVSVSISHTCVGAGHVADNVAYVEAGDATPDTAVARIFTNYVAAVQHCLNMTFVVPAGSYYKVTDDDLGGGASALVYWTEWTIL